MASDLKNKILTLVLCFLIGFAAAACATRTQPDDRSESVPPSSQEEFPDEVGTVFYNTLQLPPGPYNLFDLPRFTEQIAEKYAQNADTVGWLRVPNTTIDDVVVWYPGDRNQYYLRRDFNKNYSFNGLYYADFRCKFEGGAAGLSPNTVIYGHSMSDDPLDYRKQFSPLKFFKDEAFAKANPYIYFSVAEEDMAWEIFAVMHASTQLPYNTPNPRDFAGIISESRARSLYTYDTEVTANDKILTLSTCTYSLPDGRKFPVSDQETGFRYVIMAKLVTDRSKPLKQEASLTRNTAMKAP